MKISQFFLMRHELLLVILAVLTLGIEVFSKNKNNTIELVIFLFFINTIIGFFPYEGGSLFGAMYQTDKLRVLMKNILNIGTLIVLLQSADWLKSEFNKHKALEFIIIIICTLVGMNYMISSGDFIMFFLGLELATIPLAILAAYDSRNHSSAEAGIKLILSSAFSTGISLFGVSLIYGATGSIYFDQIQGSFSATEPMQILGFVFFVSGLAFKISLIPFHFWTADVYEGAPINVTSYLSVVSKGAAVFIFVILLFTVFGSLIRIWENMIYVLSILTMTVGNLFAIRQKNIKRFLAFSSIAQAGFILLGIIGSSQLAMASVIYFVLVYIFSNLAAFGVVSVIAQSQNKLNIDDYNGLYLTNPKLSLVMMLSLFSLAGIPPVAGFFGKFFLFTVAAQQGYYILVLIAGINATISLYYYLLLIKAMFINKSKSPIPFFKSDIHSKIAFVICVIGILVTGFANQIFDFINSVSIGI